MDEDLTVDAGHALSLAEFLMSLGRTDDALDVIARGLEHGSRDRAGLASLQDQIGAR